MRRGRRRRPVSRSNRPRIVVRRHSCSEVESRTRRVRRVRVRRLFDVWRATLDQGQHTRPLTTRAVHGNARTHTLSINGLADVETPGTFYMFSTFAGRRYCVDLPQT